MYSARMRLNRKIILALTVVSFLTITMSGFHLHADVGGHDDITSHEHDLHQATWDDLDHDTEHVDVSVFEPARGFSKVETMAPVVIVPERAAQPAMEICWSKDAPSLAPRDYSRRRPPLRAPPISV